MYMETYNSSSHLKFQLCITINNIEHVRRALYQLPEAIRFQEVKQAMGGSTDRLKYTLDSVVKDADETILWKIKHVVDRVADKVGHVYYA